MKDHLKIAWLNTDWSVLPHDRNQSVSSQPAANEPSSVPYRPRRDDVDIVLTRSLPSREPRKDLEELDTLLQRARRDAEALASTTSFPALLLPCLREEKETEAHTYWRRQQSIRKHSARLWAQADPVPTLLAA